MISNQSLIFKISYRELSVSKNNDLKIANEFYTIKTKKH